MRNTMMPPPEAVTGRKLTFEQAVAHIGGMDAFITDNGRRLIDENRRDYIWKYPEHGYCTFCGGDVGDLRARQSVRLNCPACGREVIFKHESRGHTRVYDQFVLYEWRKSVLDGESIALTAAHVWRNSNDVHPEREPLNIDLKALYVFRPGKAATVYKARDRLTKDGWRWTWEKVDSVLPTHTKFGGGYIKVVMDQSAFRRALEGTRIGRTYDALKGEKPGLVNEPDLLAVANCARRPWLEYLAKCGQEKLAKSLLRENTIPREIVANQRAKKPRELLGLTEAQWHEVRRDHIELDMNTLWKAGMLRRMGLGDWHMAQIMDLPRRKWGDLGYLNQIAPSWPETRKLEYHTETIGDLMQDAGVSDKLRRKVARRIIADRERVSEWRDYYAALKELGEDMTDPALLLPRDMMAMHDRMHDRLRILRDELNRQKKIKEAEAYMKKHADFVKRLEKLREEFTWNACGLVLRPYENALEVIDEGRALSICIGNYAERYLRGDTIICCLRKAEEPDVPWRAVEFSARTGRVVQDRGYRNDRAEWASDDKRLDDGTRKQLRLFWASWDRHQMNKKKVRVSA